VEKPEGYKTDSMVKYEGNVFIANFWASKPGEGEANEQLLLSVNLSLVDH
jgi:hypothetical protein